MSTSHASYRKLLKRVREIAFLSSSAGALSWDQETFMPPGALPYRAEQLAWLRGQSHRRFTARTVGELISDCEQAGFDPASDEAANVREWRRQYDRATKVPPRLVEKLERTTAHAREAWREARKQSKFRLFKPHFDKILSLTRQMADCIGYKESPYDALLDDYEPGVTASALRETFTELRAALASILPAAVERSSRVPGDLLRGHYPIAAQQAFNRKAAEAIGFDFSSGRIDPTTHPFCSRIGARDCRLTTRYDETDFVGSLYSVLHEAGHGLYEQGLPQDEFGTPLGSAVSLGIHESQSRLWENHIGRSAAFWEYWHPTACEFFPDLKKLSPEQITAAINRVTPSFIRTESDQMTYDLHIVLRFEVEVDLVEGRLATADVPSVWNQEFEKLLGLKVTKDSEGCLQDIHWAGGMIGYFPTYTLGNLNAAQLMHSMASANPALDQELRAGVYKGVHSWLRDKIHRQGSRLLPAALMQSATGEPTRSHYQVEYLRKKFGGG
ncbi:MAG TPA: carboxypeptidase M32 [Candidatus Sulfotelmatobacter sp.]|nr:carboxypeptidase M32 [Candidatus Sulfotelmatobacter sp.]